MGGSRAPQPHATPPPRRMAATVFVQPLDLVKNRMQLSGEGAKTKEYKTSFHAVGTILRKEGVRGIYTGYGGRGRGGVWGALPWGHTHRGTPPPHTHTDWEELRGQSPGRMFCERKERHRGGWGCPMLHCTSSLPGGKVWGGLSLWLPAGWRGGGKRGLRAASRPGDSQGAGSCGYACRPPEQLGSPGRLSAGLLRQATYTTTRLGIYTILFEKLTGEDGRPPNFLMKALIGMTAGAVGAFVGTPAEVALIRMTADGRWVGCRVVGEGEGAAEGPEPGWLLLHPPGGVSLAGFPRTKGEGTQTSSTPC